MLLNDIGTSPDSTLKKINTYLENNYGFKISEDVAYKDLVSITEQIEGEVMELKIKGDDAKSSAEISKRLLILEGLRNLREFALVQFQSPDLEHVVNGLADYVHDSFRLGGTSHQDFDECVRDGMKHYRSSKYRFPDDMIEQRVRQKAMSKINGPASPLTGPMVGQTQDECSMGMMEDELNLDEKWSGDAEVKSTGQNTNQSVSTLRKQAANAKARGDTKEVHQKDFAIRAKTGWGKTTEESMDEAENPWSGVGKRSGAFGGHAQGAKQGSVAADKLKRIDNPDLALAPTEPEAEKDPFAAHAAALKKGIVHNPKGVKPMKENLVKNLRRLLETEVSQAEVMMAAKGFASELQEMIEKIGRLQNEDLPPVTDQMRETYGTESSSAFQTQIYGALQGVMDALYTAKGQVDDAVSNMASTGQVSAQTDMDKDIGMDDGMGTDGMDDDMGAEPDLDLDNIGDELGADGMDDEFGGAEEEEPLGRSMKTEALQRKVSQMKQLVEKARKLKEAKRNG